MFQKHKAKVAENNYEAALTKWQNQVESVANYIAVAQTFKGNDSDEIMLKPDEPVILQGHKRQSGRREARSGTLRG